MYWLGQHESYQFYSSSPAMQLQRIQDLKYIIYKMLNPVIHFLLIFKIPKWKDLWYF